MEDKKSQNVSILALILSVLPLATFIPILLNITLTKNIRSVWVAGNIFCVFAGLVLSIICVKDRDSRSLVNIASTMISGFWIMLMGGTVALALFINFAL